MISSSVEDIQWIWQMEEPVDMRRRMRLCGVREVGVEQMLRVGVM